MKKDSVFCNIGRGITVNENDLIYALENETIKGAIIDVFEKEPLPESSPLWNIPEEKLLLSPHNADYYNDYWKDTVDLFINNLKRKYNGEEVINVVNK